MKRSNSNKIIISIVLLLLMLIVSTYGCSPYSISQYDYWRFFEVSRIINKYDAQIKNCYEKAVSLLNENNASLLYINETTITVYFADNSHINTENKGITQSIFQVSKKIHGITAHKNQIDFGGWGNLSANIGFIYSPEKELTIYDIAYIENENEISNMGNAYYWEQTNGDNTAYLRRINENYYYYELWW
ncbi:MAG: hypothetical protein IKI74_03395 [Christensenellaceae bacterium]|nr:hypothetical protein [Christensenellaceae bacterium]